MRITKPTRLDKIRLIFFSTRETDFLQYEFPLQKVVLYLTILGVCFSALMFGGVAIFNKVYQHRTHNALLQVNDFLKQKLVTMQSNMDALNDKLVTLEEDTEDLEVLVGLASTQPEKSGLADGFNEDEVLMASLPVDYDYQADKMSNYLNQFESRIQQAIEIQAEIENKFMQSQQKIKYIPSIRPVDGARITDRFGNRKDPFIERIRHHNGIDLAAKYGTKVYACASGVVEFVRVRYRLNKGYGKVVIINHGFGYKTLYGHLSKINVKRGQKVSRWDVIGLSGDTGRATGPHLHYEVWRNGRPQNPEDFMLN